MEYVRPGTTGSRYRGYAWAPWPTAVRIGPGPNARGLSRKHILSSIDASLKRLKTDYVDLYQIHRWDPETPIEETLGALNDVLRSGKVRYTADLHGWTRLVTMQNHYNLVYREEEREMIPLCAEEGIGVIPWSPQARGFLSGNRDRTGEGKTVRGKTDDFAKELYRREEDFAVAERVGELAREVGASNAQVALAWLLSKSVVTSPIVGASKLRHLDEAIGALSVKLDATQIARLEEPYVPHEVEGH